MDLVAIFRDNPLRALKRAPLGALVVPAGAPTISPVYLTSTCGETTGYGSHIVTDEMMRMLPEASAADGVCLYLVEHAGRAYVLASIECGYDAPAFGSASQPGMPPRDQVLAKASAHAAEIAARMPAGARLLARDEPSQACVEVGVAVPLSDLADAEHALRAIGECLGT